MAERKRQTKKAETTEKKVVSGAYKILRAREFEDGGISFDMEFSGISFYRLGIREGKNGSFITYPSYKGTDGNYYHYFYLPLSDDTQDKIIQSVYNRLDDTPEEE